MADLVVAAETWTDPRVTSGQTKTGRGAIARAHIPAGEVIQVMGGTLVSTLVMMEIIARYEKTGVYYNAVQVDEDRHIHLADVMDVPMNHSCDPNCWMLDELTIGSRREIAPGEELTIDYSTQTVQSERLLDMDCECGAAECRTVIHGDDWMRPELQARYAGHFMPFINRRIAEKWPGSPIT